MIDVLTIGREPFQAYLQNRSRDPLLQRNAAALERAFSTYSDRELDAIKMRIESCRDRFVREGSGPQRKICLCSVLQDVKDGNGGSIPIEEWERAYEQLGCAA